ncbi:hypothetical protein EJ04DRAFT_46929 [Polyplosphaeria fusca]|uniref:Uncharacterized protein n=1 Tax=Polyplosphaeria fusca TaxID=682080 RepID=A0A9P4UVV3_9PLEO|nr:hypothetical protein EJ04DRAFT_46929 [Polyplosphaeria fusca]
MLILMSHLNRPIQLLNPRRSLCGACFQSVTDCMRWCVTRYRSAFHQSIGKAFLAAFMLCYIGGAVTNVVYTATEERQE